MNNNMLIVLALSEGAGEGEENMMKTKMLLHVPAPD